KIRPEQMEIAARFSTLARRDLPFVEYAWEFCGLAMMSGRDDATINSLFWIEANYYRPVDLPDTTGLSWREGILRCLESVRPQSRTSPLAHPEPSQPTPRHAEPEPDPPADGEPEPRMTEPLPKGATAREIATPVGREGAEDSIAARPSNPAAPPRFSAPSSPPSPVGPPAPPGSLVPPAPPWSVVILPLPQNSTPPAAPRRSVPPAPPGSSLSPAPPQSSVAPALLRTSGSPPRSSVSPRIIGSPSPPWAPSPPAPLPS
ncbi:hypothetical protein M9458_018001, partial [Cirrhinus mrigala]